MPKDFHQHAWDAPMEANCRQIVQLALFEDLSGQQDWTTVALVPKDARASARIVAREPGIVSGLRTAPIIFEVMDAPLEWVPAVKDGDWVESGSILAKMDGSARAILTSERLLLNFLGRLSGIATRTAAFVRAVQGTSAKIYDTRKTTPGWRLLEKYAVRCGGGKNHRSGLYDAILIKDNHLAFLRDDSVTPIDFSMSPVLAIQSAHRFLAALASNSIKSEWMFEIEVDTLSQFEAVLPERPDIILLDNMNDASLRKAVALRDQRAPDTQLEASGGVTLETVGRIASAGVDRISVGAITHSAANMDLSLEWIAQDDCSNNRSKHAV
ncbi:MAG: carboxylating nicotinate-nucleotide diphosphorylase [Pirellulales bacterium]|nr:carboxylating nicotinate-nucleotide diphosphorylase [Pirellulales bacterium]